MRTLGDTVLAIVLLLVGGGAALAACTTYPNVAFAVVTIGGVLLLARMRFEGRRQRFERWMKGDEKTSIKRPVEPWR